MKIDIEAHQDQEGNHYLELTITSVSGPPLISRVPLGKFPMYVLYKKLTSEFHHFDYHLNEEGVKFLEEQKAQQAAQNGSTEQGQVPGEPPQAPETH